MMFKFVICLWVLTLSISNLSTFGHPQSSRSLWMNRIQSGNLFQNSFQTIFDSNEQNSDSDEDFESEPTRIANSRETIQKACQNYSREYSSPSNYVYGGTEAGSGEFPWMAALLYGSRYRSFFACGGTIISEYFVLTAAHCTRLNNGMRPTHVRVGSIKLNGRSGQDYKVQQIIAHEDYSSRSLKNDIALLRLSRKISFSWTKHPACLETDTSDENSNVDLSVTGWGETETQYTSNSLLTTKVRTVPLQRCRSYWANVDESQYCARAPGADSCRGDSGGPLHVSRNSYTAHVIGVVSFGSASGCALDKPGVYTRVAHFSDWIASHVWPNDFNLNRDSIF